MKPNEKKVIRALVDCFIEGCGIDGGDIFEILLENDILEPPVPFDPNKHTDRTGSLEAGDDIFFVKAEYQ